MQMKRNGTRIDRKLIRNERVIKQLNLIAANITNTGISFEMKKIKIQLVCIVSLIIDDDNMINWDQRSSCPKKKQIEMK